MLAHVPSFGRNAGGSLDFLAYPVPKACMHVLGTGVPRHLGVARSASSRKAAQALGCSLTPGLRISFGPVTCMARAASVPGLWTPSFLLLCGACLWVSVVVGLEFRLRPATPGWGVGVCVCLRARSVCTPRLPARVCGVGVCAWARASAAPRHSWLGCWGLCVFVCAPRLYPATPGWGVQCGCVCSGSGFGCNPPLLAGVLWPVCVCVRAPLVPRHSWLGCAVWVCVLRLGFRLQPATPGWGVVACVCLCARSACTPPLLAGLCGVGVCAWARVSAAPRHSWLGCWGACVPVCAPPVPCDSWLGRAVWIGVLGLQFRLCPATLGWGVGVFVCLCAHSAFTMPLVDGLCGVGACAGARVLAAPRHSWLGCWGVCVLVCSLCLCPPTPGSGVRYGRVFLASGCCCSPSPLTGVLGCACLCARSACTLLPLASGVRCGCVCLGPGFGCAPPLLAGVLGCVCACVRASLVPRHSWPGCAVWVCVLGLGFWPRPATPGLGVGVCVCLCLHSACTMPLVGQLCVVNACAGAEVSAAPRHSWLGCWGVCMFACALRLYPATPGCGVRCGCVCLGSGFGCAPPLLAGVLGPVCVCVRAPLVPCHSWLGCAVWRCVFGLQLGLRPATPGWGVGACVCLCGRSACTPPLLAGVCGALCVLGLGFRLRPATPGWGVGACVCLCARPLVLRHTWLGCAVWVCVLGLGFRLRPATPGWSVGVRVCLCALCPHPATPGWGVRCGFVSLGSGFGCAPPLLAGVLRCVCACVRAPLVPRHSRRGCAAWVFVLGLRFRLRPATPGWGFGVCVCLLRAPVVPPHSWLVCAVWACLFGRHSPPLLTGVLGRACLCARSACTSPLLASGVRCGCVCLGPGFGCAPPLLAGVLGCVCACVRAPLVPRHSWPGCAVWVYVLGLGFRLRPATPGWCVAVCVCSCAHSECTMPLVAGVCGLGVCAWARVSAAPCHPWLGCWGVCVLGPRSACALPLLAEACGVGVCVWTRVVAARHHSWLGCWGVRLCVRAPLLARHSWLGCAVWVCVLELGFRLRPATPGWGVGVCLCLCGLGVCAWARVSAAPRHPWLGCWGVCVLGPRSACALPLLAEVCGVGVCVWTRVVAAPNHSWLGCWGVRLCVRGPLLARHSWLGCAVWVCVLGLGFRLRPATPGWGVRVCVCLCAHSACTPPLLAGVCGVGACAWARVLAAPRHSWLGCWAVCVFACALRSYPATPGWSVRCGCVCLGSGFSCAPPLLAGVLGCVCACVRSACTLPLLVGVCGVGVCVWAQVSAAPRHSWLGCWGLCVLVWPLLLYPATPGWGVRCGWVCLGSGFGCAPPLLAGVLGPVCACVAAPFVPRHSRLGCAVRVCVLRLGFWLRPATPGWGVGACVCSCARSACSPPLLAGECGLGVCAWARVSAAPLHS